MAKVSGALKRLINKMNSGSYLITKESHPENYDKAIEKIEQRKAFIAGRPEREAKRQSKDLK